MQWTDIGEQRDLLTDHSPTYKHPMVFKWEPDLGHGNHYHSAGLTNANDLTDGSFKVGYVLEHFERRDKRECIAWKPDRICRHMQNAIPAVVPDCRMKVS